MAEIEVKLHELHAAARLGQAPVTNGGMSGPRSTEVEPPRVFARVNSVAQGSPAAITVSLIYTNILFGNLVMV